MSARHIMISSGRGPEECGWVVARLCESISSEAAKCGLSARVVDATEGVKSTYRSAIMEIEGAEADRFSMSLEGTHQWIGRSMFRPHHKRKNWFVSVALLPLPEEMPELAKGDVRIEAAKASGPGGQHVNKTESAVRATHIPTGITVTSQEERSQHANRRLALAKLAKALADMADKTEAENAKGQWGSHNELERGNAIRVYEGERFRRRC